MSNVIMLYTKKEKSTFIVLIYSTGIQDSKIFFWLLIYFKYTNIQITKDGSKHLAHRITYYNRHTCLHYILIAGKPILLSIYLSLVGMLLIYIRSLFFEEH